MSILVIGSGGREHAIAWRLTEESNVFVLPGNPGMETTPHLTTLNQECNLDVILECVKKNKIKCVIIGPEKYLYEGWVDRLKELGVPAFGPPAAAAKLEQSKIFAKQFMKDNQIPTARFEIAKTQAQAKEMVLKNKDWSGYVIKCSGPALGKGVVVTRTTEAALQAIDDLFNHSHPGLEDGLVIEETLKGREVSLFYVCLNQEYHFLASACDHKRLFDQDEGPNTGGMGAYAPTPWIDSAFLESVEQQFVKPTLEGMVKNQTPFRGILFLGLMVEEVNGQKNASLLEYNTRFGDPETQTIMPLIQGNLSRLFLSVAQENEGLFKEIKKSISIRPNLCAVHVVKAAKGYPGLNGTPIESGQVITQKSMAREKQLQNSKTLLFYAGVKRTGNQLVTSGGRILGITATGKRMVEAKDLAYQACDAIGFQNEHYRKDIGASTL